MRNVLGGLLIAIGFLVAGLSGLCSLIFLVSEPDAIGLVALVGGIPFVVGLGLFFLGRSVLRSARLPDDSDGPEVFD